MRIDIIFSDLDGTLAAGRQGTVPRDGGGPGPSGGAGISFVPATGRFFNAIPRAVQERPSGGTPL
ncbi:MAG: hypothetical protein ACLRNQ_06060 [Flavonifractor plautii]